MFRVNVALAFEELLPDPLIVSISRADLELMRRVLEVGSELVLRHDAFEISLASEYEQFFPGCLDVVAEQHSLAMFRQDRP